MAVPSFFALAMVALLISSCDASSRDAPGGSGSRGEEMTVIHDDPKCEVMVPCSMRRCVRIGLQPKGFCNMKPDMQVYCCCLVP